MIRTFKDKEAEKLFRGERSKSVQDAQRIALRKLEQVNAAKLLSELTVFPGNNLEALKGKWKGQYSIRINDQWRICFVWKEGHAYDVDVVDYH